MAWLDPSTLTTVGISAPPNVASGLPAWLTNLSSDQQLAYYQQQMEKAFPLQVGAPDYSGLTESDPGYQAAGNSAAYNTAADARAKQFMATLSPADRANFQSLSDQSASNTAHSMNNLGLLSMATIGVGGGLYGAYGGAATAGTGGGGLATAGAESLPIAAESGTPLVTGSGFGTTTVGSNLGSSVGADVGTQLGSSSLADFAGSAPAYGGVGTSGAGAGTDAIIGADGLVQAAPTAAGGMAPGFWQNLASGNYADALGNAGSKVGDYFSSPSGIQSLGGLAASYYSANKQAGAAQNAAQMSLDQYNQTRADNTPYRQAGYSALGQIGNLMGTSGNTSAPNYGSLTHQFGAGDLNANLAPNWKFQLDQGVGAATNAANASGFSGNALKGINDYAQNYAGNAYQQAYNNFTNNQTNIYNRLSNLAGLGQVSNQITANSGTANTANAANYLTSGAAAQAAGMVGGANAINNGLNNYQGWNYLNRPVQSGGP